ncbi:BTAD domain-containing putative transcriptional regulator [Microbacterium sp. H1-D42]|uniref:BTAD domain-containing putative transcriptional regulator n=1 Tax=Microbacterium sp. H1-D42 TaxID=2925844 RepID=UPI001F53C6E5|nr:BTAD domain-containing putative transcriptional regulator [Microbacterium sp. H1-D42]UNK71936.1 tetratricopeptide repeat protein [Microbacterium sp. H1-D42]
MSGATEGDPAASIRVAVLGGVQVSVEGIDATPHGRLARMLIAALVVGVTGVASDELCRILWNDLEQTAKLHLLVHRTRASLGRADAIERTADGYRLAESTWIDLEALDDLADHSPVTALQMAAAEPFAGIAGEFFDQARRDVADRVAVVRRNALLAAVRRGDDELVLQYVIAAREEDPYDEELTAAQVTALARTGRSAEALTEFESLRRRLADELGTAPGEPLQELHLQLLDGRTPPPVTVLAQLPAHVDAVIGREEELSVLDGLEDGVTRLVLICGMGGAGKTTLALSWAASRREHFADGILYADLRGFGPGVEASPQTVLQQFLRALGHRVPAMGEPDELAALFRSATAGRRMLVVLDNVRAEAQARPLLPGGDGPVTLVTSREALTGLGVQAPARTITVGPLGAEAAAVLAADALSASGRAPDTAMARRLAVACGGLPLAIVVAAHAADDASERAFRAPILPLLETGDDATDVAQVLSWSLDGLDEVSQRVFRLLGMLTSPMTASAVVAMAGGDVAEAARAVRRLRRANLLQRFDDARLAQHDLVRELAVQALDHAADADEVARARSRLVEYYALAVDAAADLLDAGKDLSSIKVLDGRAPQASTLPAEARPEAPGDIQQASAWIDRERQTIVDVVRGADAADDAVVVRMLLRLRAYAVGDSYLSEAAALYGELLHRGERIGDVAVQAAALRLIGGVEVHTKGLSASRRRLEAALPLSRRIGDEEGESSCLNNLGEVARLAGDFTLAESHFGAALDLARQHQDYTRMTLHLANIALCKLGADHLADAEDYAQRALEAAGTAGSERGRSVALRVRADARLQQGRLEEATADARAALELSTRIAYLEGAARLRILLVRLRFAEGAEDAACRAMRALATQLGDEGLPWEQGEALLALATLLVRTGADPLPAQQEAEALHRRFLEAA